MNNEINYVSPFKKFVITIGNLPTAYLESMSYYEAITFLVNYLSNNVIPALNNNGLVVEELQAKFTELKNYVDHYFDNLDLQEEVNNKLDEMADEGTLQQIIEDYLKLNSVLVFETVSDMKLATNLKDGAKAMTLGFHNKNDGGNATYIIREIGIGDIVDEMTLLSLDDASLVAELVIDELNVKQLGAYADDIHDDSPYFNKGIEILSDNKTPTDFSERNTLLINGGSYRIENTINLSVYCKLKTIGYVTLNSYVDDVTLKLDPDGITPQTGNDRYNYLFGKLIDGEQGFRIINKQARGTTIALMIGDANVGDTSLNYNVSKASFDYITVNNFNIALKINPYNVYLDTFNHLYFEQNDYSIVIGDNSITNYYDSGENISINNSIFAGCDVVCLYNTPLQAIDLNFNECSFDYNKCLFYSPNNDEATSPGRKISIDNSHIESVSYGVSSDAEPHGILYGTFRLYQVTISNSRIVQTNNYHLFYSTSGTTYTLNLISNIILTYGIANSSDPAYQFMANDNVKNINLYNNSCSTSGFTNKLASKNLSILLPDWDKETAGTTYTLIKNSLNGTTMQNWQNAYFNKVNNTVTVVSNIYGGKSIKLLTDTSNPWDAGNPGTASNWQMLSKEFNCNAGDNLGVSLLFKNIHVSPLNIDFLFYDTEGTEIATVQTTLPFTYSANYQCTYMPRFVKAPAGTKSAKARFRCTFNSTAVNNEEFEIGNIVILKM